MLKRKIETVLNQWKVEVGHNPLVVKGCRQCGKTCSVLDFAKKNYSHVVYVNFFENPDYQAIFSGSLAVDIILMYMSATIGPSAVFVPGDTCIILDEIQECPNARAALKFFKTDGRYDVIATGSLLGISGYRENARSIPVGYETVIEMFPLDFEEFLWANGITTDMIALIRLSIEQKISIAEPLHKRFRNLLLQYTVVGGMPNVVNTFIASHNMGQVLAMQRNIVENYKDDMVKYASPKDKASIRECFESIPKQLGKENKKFQYSVVQKGATSSRYVGSLQWIEDAGIIARCYNVSITELPLDGNAIDNCFKVYMCDTGLFVSMLEDGTQADVLHGNLFGYKGAIYENLVADMLIKMQRRLYFYHKDSGLEIDFLMRYKGECVLVEVKATSGNAKSSKTILAHPEKYHVKTCIKLGDYNVGMNNNIITLPLYATFLLSEL